MQREYSIHNFALLPASQRASSPTFTASTSSDDERAETHTPTTRMIYEDLLLSLESMSSTMTAVMYRNMLRELQTVVRRYGNAQRETSN
jgi:hypothetical protein